MEARVERPVGLREIERLDEVRAFEAARPYVGGGTLLAPVGLAAELEPSIVERGLRGFVADMTVETVLSHLRRDRLPIPAMENRERYGSTDDARYWLFGFDDYRKVMAVVDERDIPHQRFLELGCATGRVCRHVFVQSDFAEVYGCDFKTMHVDWCKTHFPGGLRIFLNHMLPHLPFPDRHFDVVCAFSVFTHIDAFEDAWLLELVRILRPGGLLYLTVQDDSAWANLPPRLIERLKRTPEAVDVNFDDPSMPADRLFFSTSKSSHYGGTSFHRESFIRKFWGRYFEIEDILPLWHNHQSVVLGRVRPEA